MTIDFPFASTAPGRLCLFGEHQDYLNQPVISLALPLRCHIRVSRRHEPRATRVLELHIDIGDGNGDVKVQRYCLDALPPRQTSSTPGEERDFALAAIYETLEDDWQYDLDDDSAVVCHSTTDIPLQSGVSSSSAFCVAWIRVLDRLAHRNMSRLETAQMAHRAEVTHFGAPGGTMDHVTSAMGDASCLRIGPGMWEVTKLPELDPHIDGVWVLADSGQPKDTLGHLQRCKYDRLALIEKFGHDTFWNTQREDLEKAAYFQNLTAEEQDLWHGTLMTRDMERDAFVLWSSIGRSIHSDPTAKSSEEVESPPVIETNQSAPKGQKLAEMMRRHHEALRDSLKLSTARIERMHQSSMEAGAWGFKIVGSGGGGCAVVWSPKDRAERVSESMKAAGAFATWIIGKPSISATNTLVGNSCQRLSR